MLVLQKMAAHQDKDVDQPEATGVQPAGRVEFDSRGNSVWRWAKDVIDSTSILLKRLENKDLAIEPTQKVPVIAATASTVHALPPATIRARSTNGAVGAPSSVLPSRRRPRQWRRVQSLRSAPLANRSIRHRSILARV
jgi:hypothetical protein